MSEERTQNAPTIVNVDQAQDWDGDEGAAWVQHEERYNAAMRRHHGRLLERLQIGSHDRVLDVGCGCGQTTRDAARAAKSGRAFGVDLSARMIARARERGLAEHLTNVAFEQADAQVYPFEPGAFDLAMSRFGGMFFTDRAAAYTNIARALRPGGRLALLAWQELRNNEWILAIRGALAAGRTLPEPPLGGPGPFGLADVSGVRSMLEQAGFRDVGFDDVSEPVYFGRDGDDAFEFVSTFGFTKNLLKELDDRGRAQVLEQLRALLKKHGTSRGVELGTRAWLITARRA